MYKLFCTIVFTLSFSVASAQELASDPTISPDVWNLPFNQIAQVACHNCFEHTFTPERGSFKTVLNDVKTIELDLWDQKGIFFGGEPKKWFVRHSIGSVFTSGNDNSCTGDGRGTNDLRACLEDVKQWSDDHPGHFPITVILDKKQGWSYMPGSDRKPKDLDDLVRDVFKEALFTPADLFGDRDITFFQRQNATSDTLQSRVKDRGWPKAEDLRGRILAVLNGGDVLDIGCPACVMYQYLKERGLDGAIFAAPPLLTKEAVNGKSDKPNSQFIVMNNIAAAHKELSKNVFNENHIGRVWGNDDDDFSTQIKRRTNIAVYDKYQAQTVDSYRVVPLN